VLQPPAFPSGGFLYLINYQLLTKQNIHKYLFWYVIDMNPIELLQKVKALVFEDQMPTAPAVEPEAPAKKEFGGYMLKDGTEVYIDKLEVGGVVSVEKETMAPAPVGEHELADGTVIVVGEGGVISEIKPSAAPEATPAPESEDMGKKYEEKFSSYDAKFAALENENANLKAAFAKSEDAIKGLFELVEKLVKEPTTEPTEPVKSGFKFGKQVDNKEEKLNSIINLFK
jgi:hypothetical protein